MSQRVNAFHHKSLTNARKKKLHQTKQSPCCILHHHVHHPKKTHILKNNLKQLVFENGWSCLFGKNSPSLFLIQTPAICLTQQIFSLTRQHVQEQKDDPDILLSYKCLPFFFFFWTGQSSRKKTPTASVSLLFIFELVINFDYNFVNHVCKQLWKNRLHHTMRAEATRDKNNLPGGGQ